MVLSLDTSENMTLVSVVSVKMVHISVTISVPVMDVCLPAMLDFTVWVSSKMNAVLILHLRYETVHRNVSIGTTVRTARFPRYERPTTTVNSQWNRCIETDLRFFVWTASSSYYR